MSSPPNGSEVGVDRYDREVTYGSSGGGAGLYTFSAAEPGTYEVTSDISIDSGELAYAHVAVSRGIGTSLAGYLTAGIGLIGIAHPGRQPRWS